MFNVVLIILGYNYLRKKKKENFVQSRSTDRMTLDSYRNKFLKKCEKAGSSTGIEPETS